MQIVKQKQTHWVETAPSTTVEEYLMRDSDINGSTAIISGRYPEKGFAVNKVSKELALVLSGDGYIGTPKKKIPIVIGDCILIKPKEKYYWNGHMALFIACTPKWKARQHHFTK